MILFVDDDPKVLNVYVKLLGKMGYQVIACDSPEKALSEAMGHKNEITAIVSDYCMPNMLGTELIQAVEAIIPMISKVIVTGYAPQSIPADITLISKPYSIRTLVSVLEEKQGSSLENIHTNFAHINHINRHAF